MSKVQGTFSDHYTCKRAFENRKQANENSEIKVVAWVKHPYSRESFCNKQQYTCALNVLNILDERFYSDCLEYLKAQWMPKK